MSSPELLPPSDSNLARAAAELRGGRLVALPTETVYGLGADAANDQAVASVFEAKGRPRFNPLILHLHDVDAVEPLVELDDRARLLADLHWPGPLTLVLPRHASAPVSLLASAGLDTLAVRVPAHPVARALLGVFGGAIAAPSANRSGRVSPTAPVHVAEEFPDGGPGGRLRIILAAGKSPIGLESTVLDLTQATPVVLRPGAVTQQQIAEALGSDVAIAGADSAIKAPGMLTSHYAPALPVRLGASAAKPDEAVLAFGPDRFMLGGGERLNLSPTGDLHEAAANLFGMLRTLDRSGAAAIAVMPIPDTGLGAAINDRLRRAAAPRGLNERGGS